MGIVGKLPTTTGWQPVLPRHQNPAWRLCGSRRTELVSCMSTEISIPDAEDLKSRVSELRRFL